MYIVLYVDTGEESQEAIKILALCGVRIDVIWCKPGQEPVLPVALYPGYNSFKGIQGIRRLERILRPPRKSRTKNRVPQFTAFKFGEQGFEQL